MNFTPVAKQGYLNLFNRMVIKSSKKATVDIIADSLVKNKSRYEVISRETGVPWVFIALTHKMEANCDFDRYLGNGQPLSQRTTIVPKGRGPFRTFEAGAIDALRIDGLYKVTDWSLPHMLYLLERFNGFGYVSKGINSPYLWSFSNLYFRGKYVADGQFDPSAVSTQCGAAVILKAMILKGYVSFSETGELNTTQSRIATEKLTGNLTEQQMSELASILPTIEVLAPVVARALGGPLAGGVVALIAKELNCEPDTAVVSKTVNQTPTPTLMSALRAVSEALEPASQPTPPPPAPEPSSPFTKAPAAPVAVNPNSVVVDTDASTVKSLVSAFLFVLASWMLKDAALAHTVADALTPILIGLTSFAGGGALQWLLRRSIGNSNAATLEKLIGA